MHHVLGPNQQSVPGPTEIILEGLEKFSVVSSMGDFAP